MKDESLLDLTLFTADPLLRLFVAHRGFDAGDVPFLEGWQAFKGFLALPTVLTDDSGTFQVSLSEAAAASFEVFFGRQIIEEGDRPHRLARLVGLHFVFATEEREIEEIELWSHDYTSLFEFFRACERSAGFNDAISAPRDMSTVFIEERLE